MTSIDIALSKDLIYALPVCTVLSCPTPNPITAGYVEDNDTLSCAELYSGLPEALLF